MSPGDSGHEQQSGLLQPLIRPVLAPQPRDICGVGIWQGGQQSIKTHAQQQRPCFHHLLITESGEEEQTVDRGDGKERVADRQRDSFAGLDRPRGLWI